MRKSTALVALAALGLFAGLMPEAGAAPAAARDNVRLLKTVPGTTGGHAAVDGNRLYVGAYGLGMRIFDVTAPANPVEIGKYIPGPQSQSDPGLRADTVPDALVMDGRHIASLNGTGRAAGSQQTEFLDVTDPANPKLLWRFTGPNDGEAHNGDIVDARRLWLPSGGRGNNLIRLYDLNPLLQTPAAAPAKIFGGNINTLWLNSPYRAAAGKPAGVTPSHIHDLEVYTDYNLLLLPDKWVDQDGDGVADPTYAKRDIALYAASQDYPLTVGAGGAPNSAVYIVDITNPANPVVINKVQARPGHRYLHEVQFLQGDPHVMFTSDEDLHNGCDAGGVYSWRLSDDLTDATFLDSWFNGTGTPAPLCSAHVFSSNGSYVFMGSYQAGLQVIDFTDPADLKRAGQYIPPGANYWGALYHKGVIYAGDFGSRGLDVLEFIANPAAKGFVKAMNPSTRTTFGVTERGCAVDPNPSAPTNNVDGLIVPIPEDKRDGTHTVRAVADADPGTELDVWFYDAACAYMSGAGNPADDGPTTSAMIPEEAHFAIVDLFAGGPTWVYAQIDP
jgi:hypothetical protein